MDTRAFYQQDYEAQMRLPAGESSFDGKPEPDPLYAADTAKTGLNEVTTMIIADK
jgi:hypothetical protein